MVRRLSTVLSVLIAVGVFLAVVLWPTDIGWGPGLSGGADTQLVDAGAVVHTTGSRPARPASTAPTTSQPLKWHRPRFADFQPQRDQMVAQTISRAWDGRRRVTAPRTIAAMRHVPRHLFVEPGERASAHADHPLPIGYGQTISQPYIVALMTEALRLRPGGKVLEIGTGSGYQAAVLSELTPNVFSIEIVKPLYERTNARLTRLGYETIQRRHGDGYFGWPEQGPFDGIIVTCAAGHVPPPLFKQLAPGGRMVIPIGQPGMYQQLKILTKDPKTSQPRYETICGVAFVPMTGRAQSP